MTRMLRVAAAAAAVAASGLAPAVASAQNSFSVTCAPGVGCSQLRFGITAGSGFSLNSLQLTLSGSSAWRFIPAGGPGVYGAVDGTGPFGGFTTLNAPGTVAFMNFLDNGFTFDLGAGQGGYVQLQGAPATPDGLIVDFIGTPSSGGPITGRATFGPVGPPNTVPEPATVLLVAGGLAAVGGVARRRAVTTR